MDHEMTKHHCLFCGMENAGDDCLEDYKGAVHCIKMSCEYGVSEEEALRRADRYFNADSALCEHGNINEACVHGNMSCETCGDPPETDAVHRPSHYTRFKIEPIHFIVENGLNFIQGNIIKYVLRWDDKDGLQDLKKARRYLDMWIKELEGDPRWSE